MNVTRTSWTAGLLLSLGATMACPAHARICPPSAARRPAAVPATSREQARDLYARLPIAFEENRGQTAEEVRFLSRGPGYTLFLTGRETVLSLQPFGGGKAAVLRLALHGASEHAPLRGEGVLPGRVSWFGGAVSKQGIARYERVRAADVYPGVDLVHYGNGERLEYDFVVAPGADPERIRLDVTGAEGAEIGREGDLLLHTSAGTVRQLRPVCFQERGARRVPVPGRYTLEPGGAGDPARVGFALGEYDPRLPLTIDPVLQFSTCLGGGGADAAADVAVDAEGNAYLVGTTRSVDFPTAGAPTNDPDGPNADVFVTKLRTASGSGDPLVYSVYLHGTGVDSGEGIVVDSTGAVAVTGRTTSLDFPVVRGTADTDGTNEDAFVAVLSPGGDALTFSTYVGGTGADAAADIAGDAVGNLYVTGSTLSANFPRQRRFGPGGGEEAFVVKIDPRRNGAAARLYSVLVGGGGREAVHAVAVDALGRAAVTGVTGSDDFPLVSPFMADPGDESDDAFVVQLNPGGTALRRSTYFGGGAADQGSGIGYDSTGRLWVAGTTASIDFPTTDTRFMADPGDLADDAFVLLWNPNVSPATSFVYSTYLGGSGRELVTDLAVNASDSACVTGFTRSPDFPVRGGGTEGAQSGNVDAFAAVVDVTPEVTIVGVPPGGEGTLLYATCLGSEQDDEGLGIAVSGENRLFIAGTTASGTFPVVNGFPHTAGQQADAFLSVVLPRRLPAPRALEVRGASSTEADLTWSYAGPEVTRFVITRITGTTEAVRYADGAARRFLDTGLVPGVLYRYRVHAEQVAARSAPTRDASVTLLPVPAVPTVRASGTTCTIEWANLPTPATEYQIDRTRDGDELAIIIQQVPHNAAATGYRIQDTGLAPDTRYSYRIRTIQGRNVSSRTAPRSAITVPTAPLDVRAVVLSGTEARVNWKDVSAHELKFGVTAVRNGEVVSRKLVSRNVQTAVLTGLTPGATYEVRVSAINMAGGQTSTALLRMRAPSAPLALTGAVVRSRFPGANTAVRLTWTDRADGEQEFQVFRSFPNNFQALEVIAVLPPNSTTYTDFGVNSGQTYRYEVVARNPLGANRSNAADVSVNPPAAPTGLTAAAEAGARIRLSWTDGSLGEEEFVVERTTEGGQFAQVGRAGANRTTFIDSGLTPGVRYIYRVRAINSLGRSVPSNEASAVAAP